jgi:serine/threonine protein kinase
MTTTEASLTLRTDRGYLDAAVDIAAHHQGPAASGTGSEFLGIPGRFKILSQIGRGGMGIVYKVRDLETGEIVTLKLLKPEIAADPRMREELRKEVCLARKVTHKNVCRIHEFYRSDAASCISMEFVDGETLLSKLRRVGALPVPDAIEITRQICAGLREAHARGIVHRDLKPANIMIDQSGVVKIMDFGIARLAHETGQITTTIVGTPEYMAPEQIEVKAMGPWTDIYSLGLLLYEMITGSRAFTGESSIAIAIKQLRDSPRRPSEIVSTVSPALEAVILKCLRKNCDSRFQSIDQLDSALSRAAANVAPKPLVARIRMDVAVKYATAEWRVLQPQLVRFGIQLNGATNRLSERVHNQYKRLALVTAPADGPSQRKNRRIQIAAIATVAILGILLFSLEAGRRRGREPIAPATIISPSAQNTEAVVSSSTLSPPAESTSPGSPIGDASAGNAELSLVTNRSSEASAPDASPLPVTPADSIPQSNPTPEKRVKKLVKTRPISAPLPLRAEPNAANFKPTVPEGTSGPDTTDLMAGVASAPAAAATLSALPPAVNASSTQPSPDKPAAVVETYLEVGSFGDTKWADSAVERLTQLGFHAICVHKSLLWKQSYHVQVGPYATSAEIAEAQERLTDQGFKSHPVK